VARTVHLARAHGRPLPIEPDDVASLYDRYQNVYGQSSDRSAAEGETKA
jgi:L-ribulose-5-phosphate 4-epimerase